MPQPKQIIILDEENKPYTYLFANGEPEVRLPRPGDTILQQRFASGQWSLVAVHLTEESCAHGVIPSAILTPVIDTSPDPLFEPSMLAEIHAAILSSCEPPSRLVLQVNHAFWRELAHGIAPATTHHIELRPDFTTLLFGVPVVEEKSVKSWRLVTLYMKDSAEADRNTSPAS
jgi:hypothetical protein